jgi:hypothetical protein
MLFYLIRPQNRVSAQVRRLTKSAELVIDEEGRLAVWKSPAVQGGKQKVETSAMAMSA